MNYTIDSGSNLTSLGFTFLFLKYLLPVVLGFIVILIAIGTLYWFYKKMNSTFRGFNLDDRNTQVAVIIGLFIAIAFVAVLGSLK